ncbi:hypothetical protein BJ138DRAFT_1138284 [Hygrophoropsis aurantiaca]|uniref:Uncharacterized protein n=1 Tax=Hygrophoropsis aurantiaca TaxID=72124 RepID=A0ACB7ZWE3_9AGAM|nr:hypothetical protein BJ138DRAFT_1138284 [Hygrophoropsis aurantiaca]
MVSVRSFHEAVAERKQNSDRVRNRVVPMKVGDDAKFPHFCTDKEKRDIIESWQDEMSPSSQERGACAVCAHNVQLKSLQEVEPNQFPLTLLQNPCLPEHTLPTTYNLVAYDYAILHPRGMVNTDAKDKLLMCSTCKSQLVCKRPKQPRNALANFQYYAIDRLPSDIKSQFDKASPFDLMLISRAQASQVTHHYRGKRGMYQPEETSQRYTQGNVGILPQDSISVRQYLPPNADDIKQSMCTLFTSCKTKPTRETLKQLRPILVSKPIVKDLIEFLIARNAWYQAADVTFSEDNFSGLVDNNDDNENDFPAAVEICHIEDNEKADVSAPDEDSCNENAYDCDIFLEAHTPANREAMKLRALSFALDKNKFLASRTGDEFIGDHHPDPWGIGGFNHPARTPAQKITFEAQYDSPFVHDANFAFICWNIIRKKEVNTNSCFRVSKNAKNNIAAELKSVAPDKPFSKPKNTLEKKALSVMRSAGYKVARRNEIRGLMRTYGTPALCLLATVGAYDRAKFVAENLAAAARAFDIQMKAFFRLVVKHGHGPGLFGEMEAQGRGTLHCHLLLWIKGNPCPQSLRDRMREELGFKSDVFRWLETNISSLPDADGIHMPKPVRPKTEMDPRLEVPPQSAGMDDETFAFEFREFVKRLAIECNWHHLKDGEKRTEDNCRMGINGKTESIGLRRLHPRINNFNDVVIFLLQCNMDIKYALVYYINLQVHTGISALNYAIHRNETNASDDQKRSLLTKSMSHQQVMNYYTSHSFGVMRLFEFDSLLKSYESDNAALSSVEAEATDDEASDCVMHEEQINLNIDQGCVTTSSQIEDYQLRSEDAAIKDMSLWEYCEMIAKERRKPDEDESLDDQTSASENDETDPSNCKRHGRKKCLRAIYANGHTQKETHIARLRKVPIIPVTLHDAFARPDRTDSEREKFCRSMLLLFKCWQEPSDIKEHYTTYTEAFEAYSMPPHLQRIISNCEDIEQDDGDNMTVVGQGGLDDDAVRAIAAADAAQLFAVKNGETKTMVTVFTMISRL